MSVGESVVGNLIAKLTLDTVGFNTNADSAIKKIGTVAATLTGIGVASTKTAKTVVKSATDFETAFTGVRKTVDAPVGANAEEFFTSLRQEIIDMSTELPVAATEIAGVYQAAGQLGIESENLTGFSRAMIQLASATNLSSEEAAATLAQFANVMQTDQTLFENMGSSIVALGNNFATNERQIVNFAQEMAIAGKLSGMSEADILGLGTAMASMGLDAASSGTAFQRFTQTVSNAVAEGNGDLTVLADTAKMTAEDFSAAWTDDSSGAFMSFLQGLGQLDNAQQLAVFEQLNIGQQQEITMLQSLASNTDLVSDAVNMSNTAWEENTALVKEADTANSTTAAQMQLFSNNLSELAITIGTNLLPVLNDLLENITPIVENMTKWSAEHPNLTTAIIATGVALGGLGSIMTMALPIISLFNLSLAPISGTALVVAGAIAGVGLIIGLLISRMDELSTHAKATSEDIENAFGSSTTAIVENGYGELEVQDRKLFTNDEGKTGYYSDVAGWDGLPIFVEVEQDAAEAVAETTAAFTEQETAVDQCNAILADMQQSVSGLTESLGTDGLGDAMKMAQELTESEAFQQFTNQPISEEVGTSWEQFGTSVQNASSGFGSLTDTLSKGTAADQIAGIGGEAEGAAGKFTAMSDAIYTVIDALLALNRVNVGGGAGGGKANIVVDPRASGGPVTGGSPYIVGEEGPELFVPRSSGTIIPNDAMASNGFGQVVVNFNGDVIGDEKSIFSLVTRAVKAGIRQEVRAAA